MAGTHHKQDTVSFGYELTNGNRISMGSNQTRPNFESFKMRQPFFGESDNNKSIEDAEEDHQRHKMLKMVPEREKEVSHNTAFRPLSDDHISYDSSLDHDNLEPVKPKSAISKVMPGSVYQEDLTQRRAQFDSLQQDSLKINPLNTQNYDSKTGSVALSRADLKSRKESSEVQPLLKETIHRSKVTSVHTLEENSKYFVKKTIQPSTREVQSSKYEEGTRRNLLKNPPVVSAINATYYSTQYERSKDESDGEKTREKIMHGQQQIKHNPSNESRLRSSDDKHFDFSSRNQQISNNGDPNYIYVDQDEQMFTSKYISNPFKESELAQGSKFLASVSSKYQPICIPQHQSRADQSIHISSHHKSYHQTREKPPGQRKPPSDLRLDNTIDYHSISNMTYSNQFATPKHSVLRGNPLKLNKSPNGLCPSAGKSKTPTSASGAQSFQSKNRALKSSKVEGKSGQHTQGLSRKDVLDILKLHTALQAKIQYLEGKVTKLH
jgi:hypothetical protein